MHDARALVNFKSQWRMLHGTRITDRHFNGRSRMRHLHAKNVSSRSSPLDDILLFSDNRTAARFAKDFRATLLEGAAHKNSAIWTHTDEAQCRVRMDGMGRHGAPHGALGNGGEHASWSAKHQECRPSTGHGCR